MYTFTHLYRFQKTVITMTLSMISMLICADIWPDNGHVSAQAARADWTLPGGQRGPRLTHRTFHSKPLHSDLNRRRGP